VARAIQSKEIAGKKNKNILKKLDSNNEWGEILGNQAWALAELGQYEQAEQALERAFTIASPKNAFDLAALYYRSGEVKRVGKDYADAAQNFQLAIQSDPQGVYTQWAETALKN
jgi:tetratricopeptide (TPR) repeat protein